MLFVDGENITKRAEEMAQRHNLALTKGARHEPNVFFWFKERAARSPLYHATDSLQLQTNALRAHFYTSVIGNDVVLRSTKEALRALGFEPLVFKRSKGDRPSKGVDIALTKDMLSHAHQNHYDVAILVSGDGDYVPLVEEVKRLGKVVHVAAFSSGLSEDLKLAADYFYDLDRLIAEFPV
jgi:uncharacterized LabA/DUF88 family protein